ncbi:DinB family protein [Olivibacter sp. SDN3]|uniref:DinB family protein n=1 Tax=Olivibacter sp. SDN3 TaxID=2764720 RepID=UPI001651A451|nr:DinB family protein [Olivibacter sp. SDN3]QNL51026.1 DinB family protein [Olivibacter sp. SDN3]
MKPDTDHLEELFKKVTLELVQQLNSLTEEQLNKKFVPDKWTPGQLGVHLYKSYASIDTIKGTTEAANRPVDKKIPSIKDVFLNFEARYDAPEEIIPPDGWVSKDELINGLRERIDQQNSVWQQDDLSRLCIDFAIPGYGTFTRLEWLALNTYHTLRHVKQLKEQIGF